MVAAKHDWGKRTAVRPKALIGVDLDEHSGSAGRCREEAHSRWVFVGLDGGLRFVELVMGFEEKRGVDLWVDRRQSLMTSSIRFTSTATGIESLAEERDAGRRRVVGLEVGTNQVFQKSEERTFSIPNSGNSNSNKPTSKQVKLSGRTGMLILYTPSFVAAAASFCLFPHGCFRFMLLNSALTIHFFKRIFEVLFVHKYSSSMVLDTVILISPSYFATTANMIYAQRLAPQFPEPLIDLKYPGTALFLVGIFGNFYHHYLLSKLRGKDDKGYKIPRGGFFNLVMCPHYLFEILVFFGLSFISQTLYSFSVAISSALYLMGRSYATRKWYLSKFENFPEEVKALIPYVF
ncbi:hypothetical protein L1049_011564 [Liquidambar formosana]|uniref:3-oxo-5-alpha-steroid 4-dehydrogenase C-terminal domain-containing protein n=1 Tax=Liquidambar formosana TaxID=63359 RepID=A0AAP0RYH5_LIQFO